MLIGRGLNANVSCESKTLLRCVTHVFVSGDHGVNVRHDANTIGNVQLCTHLCL